MLNKNRYLKLSSRQLLVLLPRLSVLHFFAFGYNRYLKKAKFQWKNGKFFQSVLKLLCWELHIQRIYSVSFQSISKAQFFAFLSYLRLSISQQISQKFSENQEFFRYLVKFSLLWSQNKSYLNLLIWRLFVVFSWFPVVSAKPFKIIYDIWNP